MTTRLTRWLNTLDNFEEKMSLLPAVRRYGRLTRATGLVLEATGLQLPLGATCVIERQDGNETQEVESEVVGFNGQRLFLMPLEEVEGVLPGARVYAKNIAGEGLQSGKQLPLGPALLGRVLDGSGKPLDGNMTGFHLITDNGGFFPHGLLPALVLVQGVVFAFASIELVGTAAGECKDPQTMVPKAINSVIWRIGLFYVGSVVLLVLLLPWNAYQAGQSPFVTFFSKLGVPYVGSIMNIVVLTAALSSLNSGLYSTGRILRSMSMGGSAPKFMSKMSRQHVPYAGILATLVVYVFGVFLNYLVPSQVFEIVLNVAALGIIASWAFIVVCQMRLRKAIKEGKAAEVSFKLPGAPVTSWLTLLFLFSVLVLMAFDYPNGTYTIATIPLLAVLLIAGWFGVRKRVQEIHSTAPVHPDDAKHNAPLVEETSR